MSRTIDERVVSMQFDNRQFESNVKTSLSTLDKLKQSLNLKGASKGLENINSAAKGVNLNPIGHAVDSVRVKFSALQVMGITALTNITNSAVNAGKRIAKAFTIDPIKSGFQEYETQINAVQTILANTESKGTTLNDVNKALDTLNTYADKTIYNFTEMTRNIGTFTAAGVDLETSVNAIQGIANLAAVSGSNAQQASTAMYQLSQALASGTVKLMDWNSVVNAGMGGEVFQNALKETARVHGINIDKMIKKEGSFRETLQEGWLTSEILTETLQKFTLTTEGLTNEQIEANRQMLKSKGYTDEQIESIFKLGETATNAATKVKTFTQLMDTLKEAAQSGWTQTWELIVGDFDGAKTLWTGVSDSLGAIISASAESRNKFLKGAMLSNWDKLVEKINDAGIETSDFEEKVKSVLSSHSINPDKLIEKYGSLEEAFRSGAVSSKWLKEAVDGLGKSMTDLSSIDKLLRKGSRGEDVKKIQQALKDLGYDLGKWDVDGILGNKTTEAIKEFQKLKGLKVDGIIGPETIKALEEASGKSGKLVKNVDELIDGVTELGGRELLIDSFKNAWEALLKPLKMVKAAWRKVFPPMSSERLYEIIEGVHKFSETLNDSIDVGVMNKIFRTFKGLFSIVKVGTTIVGGGFKLALEVLRKVLGLFNLDILDATAYIGDALVKFSDWVTESGFLAQAFDKTIEKVVEFAIAIKDWVKQFVKLPEVQEKIKKITDGFNGLKSMSLEDIIAALTTLKDKIVDFFKNFDINEVTSNLGTYFNNAKNAISDFLSKISEKLGITKEKFEEFKNKLSEFFTTIKQKLDDHKGAIAALGSLLVLIFILSKIKKALASIAKPLEAFSGIGESIENFFNSFTAINNAKAKEIKSRTIMNMAKSIALIAGAIWVIAKIPQDDLWRAVGVIGIISGVLLAMMLLSKLISKIGKGSEQAMLEFGYMMKGLGTALLLMAVAVKIMGSMDTNEIKQGVLAISAFFGLISLLMLFTKFIGERNVIEFGKMIKKLSSALLMLTLVVWIFGSMDTDTLVKGGLAVLAFLTIFGIAMRMTSGMSKNTNEFGKMIRNFSVSLLLIAGAVAIFGNMDTDTLVKGGLAVVVFVGLMIGAMNLTKNVPRGADKFGKMMLSISASLILMAAAVKILGEMDTHTLVKGGLVVAGFALIVTGLMKATSLLGRHSYNAGKMGVLLLSFSGAVLIIAGSIAALSMIEGRDLVKALAAIAGIGLIFAGLLVATKYAKNIKTGTIIALSIAIGIMAASITALSFINPEDLRNATLALGGIIGMLSLLAIASKSVKLKSMIAIAGMALIVTGIAFILNELVKHADDADKSIKVATAIGILIGSLAASCALLAVASKYGPKSIKGLGMLAGMVGIVSLFAGLAIWQLPNIAEQLSKFMIKLKPFIQEANEIKPEFATSIKTLGEAMLAFTKAGAVYTVFNIGGGMTRAFADFVTFIKNVLPIVKDLALEVSGKGVKINTTNLNAILNAVSSLAEAASKGPNIQVIAGAGGGKGIFGGFVGISVPQLSKFTEWITQVVPVIKDLALSVSGKGVKINGDAISSVCQGVVTLAEAANSAPKIEGIAGAGGGKGFAGGFVAISVPQLTKFKNWLEEVVPIVQNFAVGISSSAIKPEHGPIFKSVCEGVKALCEGAGEAPSAVTAAGLTVFNGGIGAFAAESIPLLTKFKDWIKDVIPIVKDFAGDISKSKITGEHASIFKSVCEGAKALCEGASASPSITAGAGLFKFAGGIGMFAGADIPLLDNFKTWLEKVIPVVSDFAGSIVDSKIKPEHASTFKSICEGVKALCEGCSDPPGVTIGAGLASFGPVVAGGAYFKVDDIMAFKDWIEAVAPVISGFSIDIKEASLTEADGAAIKSICEAVKILAEAANIGGGGDEVTAGFAALGPAIGGFVQVKSTDLTDFANWLGSVDDPLAGIASSVSADSFTQDDANRVTQLCKAVKTLGEAASFAPTKEEYKSWFSEKITTTELDKLQTWIEEMITTMNDIGVKITESDAPIDSAKLTTLASNAKTLSEGVQAFCTGMNVMVFDKEAFSITINGIADAMIEFSGKVKEIDDSSVSSAAGAAKSLSDTLLILTSYGSDYSSIDATAFKEKIVELATAMKEFSGNMEGVDVSTGVAQISALTSMFKDLSGTDFTNAGNLASALSTLDSSSIDEFIAAFNDTEKLSGAGTTMITNLINGITSAGTQVPIVLTTIATASLAAVTSASAMFIGAGLMIATNFAMGVMSGRSLALTSAVLLATSAVDGVKSKERSFYIAGYNMGLGFGNGLKKSEFAVKAKAKALAQAALDAAKKTLDEHSPSKKTYKMGEFFGEGFVNGIEVWESKSYGAGEDIADKAKTGLSKAISKIGAMVESGIDAEPTIRPVLDLSNVKAGAGAINGMFGMKPSIGVMSNLGVISSSMNSNQNGRNDDVISAINELGSKIGNMSGDTYNVNGITYDDGSNITEAVKTLVRAARVERRM